MRIFNARARGFTLLELVIVLAIIGIFGVMVMPLFRGRQEKLEAQEFVAQLNVLMQAAWQQALFSQNTQKIYIDFRARTISLMQKTLKDTDVSDKHVFAPVTGLYLPTEVAIPATYFFKNFYVQGEDLVARLGAKLKDAWFFLSPSGVAQDVIINIINLADDATEQDAQKIGLVLNPFSAQFEYYDTYQKP
jgi:prepilin-type N-terminal cleavage/methylation domain-containing protein